MRRKPNKLFKQQSVSQVEELSADSSLAETLET